MLVSRIRWIPHQVRNDEKLGHCGMTVFESREVKAPLPLGEGWGEGFEANASLQLFICDTNTEVAKGVFELVIDAAVIGSRYFPQKVMAVCMPTKNQREVRTHLLE